MDRNHIRIIAGKWRGRKITFPSTATLRPTPDRIRETLFNWLAPHIIDARCLDLFAGSGALSFEALSRGAGIVIALEKDTKVVASLKANAEILLADNIEILQTDSIHWMEIHAHLKESLESSFDIIFLESSLFSKITAKMF